MSECFVIAEAGVNHNGSLDLAKQLIDVAVEAGADAVKFQTFFADDLVVPGTETAAYQKQQTAQSDQYQLLKELELSYEAQRTLFEYCCGCGIEFMSTPFSIEAVRFLVELGVQRLKIASGEVTNFPLLEAAAGFDVPIILSSGMATLAEVKDAVACISRVRMGQNFSGALHDVLSVLQCTSNYPTLDEDVNLRAMETMACALNLPVGFSDHTVDNVAAIAAVALGACVIEKHFTLDHSMVGPDHQASLNPEQLRALVGQIRQVSRCLGDGVKKPCARELAVKDLVRRSVTLAVDKKAGEMLGEQDLVLRRPGTGLPPEVLSTLVGRRLKTSKVAGTQFEMADLVDA